MPNQHSNCPTKKGAQVKLKRKGLMKSRKGPALKGSFSEPRKRYRVVNLQAHGGALRVPNTEFKLRVSAPELGCHPLPLQSQHVVLAQTLLAPKVPPGKTVGRRSVLGGDLAGLLRELAWRHDARATIVILPPLRLGKREYRYSFVTFPRCVCALCCVAAGQGAPHPFFFKVFAAKRKGLT